MNHTPRAVLPISRLVQSFLSLAACSAAAAYATSCAGSVRPVRETVDLRGTWAFALDTQDVGERERWFARNLEDRIVLPGSTDEYGFGVPATKPELTRLTRAHRYVGPAWYQRVIDIPPQWQGRHVELFLERAMWETKAWFDEHFLGANDSLCVPHRFDLSAFISPGRHRLTLRIDNRLRINVGHDALGGGGWLRMWTMALTEESQTNWNGAIGRIQLQVSAPVWIERIEAFPDLDHKRVRVVVLIRSRIGAAAGEVSVSARCGKDTMGPARTAFRTKGPRDRIGGDPLAPRLGELTGSFRARYSVTRVQVTLPFGDGVKLWDEFSPAVYELVASLEARRQGEICRDEYRTTFGLRKLEAEGRYFKLNGRTIFLRGNQDNCVHPKTGYPPMDKESWLTYLRRYKDYGLNNVRFHSWCPPEAAFAAADELGMLLHVECPLWDGSGNVGLPPARAAFIRAEAERILDEYGNHPCFCFFSMGNELGSGAEHYLQYLVEVLRKRDPRHLYTATSHPADSRRNDDFFVSARGRGTARGLRQWNGRRDFDYREALSGFRRPFVAHEIGQWTSFPDFTTWFNEDKYTGPLKAHYIGMLRRQFERFHPLRRAHAFAQASGALQVLLYKAEVEGMLRTPTLAGFHLNGLIDYPGEGIALIGVLDAMGDSKGTVSPEGFRRFCSATVPLARVPKPAWLAGELFEVPVEVRHHGPEDLRSVRLIWRIVDRSGAALYEGRLGPRDVPTGGLTSVGTIETTLGETRRARELTLEVRLEGTDIGNAWRFWVYPNAPEPRVPPGVVTAIAWTDKVAETLQEGGRVLLMPARECVREPVTFDFFTIFWGRGLFGDRMPRALGILCNPEHPALARFPTRMHADWQWHDLLRQAYALDLSGLPFSFEPIVFAIDDFNLSHRLAVLFEARVSKGRLLISTLDLGAPGKRSLVQREMLRSLLAYTGSAKFAPRQRLSIAHVAALFRSRKTVWQETHRDNQARAGEPVFVEDFAALQGGKQGRQVGTGRPLRHGVRLRGWDARGFHGLHAVQRPNGAWAVQILSSTEGEGDTVLTLLTPIAANERGRKYTVRWEAGPTVYENPGQATREGDRFAIELRRADGSVLARHTVAPGPWNGEERFKTGSFTYRGDGRGNVTIRIAPVPTGDTRFTGALSRLSIIAGPAP